MIARADSISPYYLLFGRVPGSEREVKVKLKMPESLFDCYETAYISRIHFEIRSRLENSHTVTGQIEAMDYLTEEVHKAKECCTGTTNFKSECVTCAWTEEAAVAFLQVEGFDQVEEIETNGQILSEPDCVCSSEPADNYQATCMGANCVEKQVGVGDFEIYQNTFSIDTLYHELQRIATYFDSLGIAFYAGITDNRMFCVEGESMAFKSQESNKDMGHFQSQYDAAQVAFWFHLAEVNGEERIHIRQKGFEGEVLDCCCELIPGDCRGAFNNPFCENLLEDVAHYYSVCFKSACSQIIEYDVFLDVIKNQCGNLRGGNGIIESFDPSNVFQEEEPKWGQLGSCEDIKNEISMVNLSGSLLNQLDSLDEYFDCNVKYMRHKSGSSKGCLDFNSNASGFCTVKKYLYTKEKGWLDMLHVFRIFKWCANTYETGGSGQVAGIMEAALSAEMAGYSSEAWQWAKNNYSAFSYEDLCSNHVGAMTFVSFYQDLKDGNITWNQVIDSLCTAFEAADPNEAPNYQYIPYLIDSKYPKIFNPASCLVGDDLGAAGKANFCEMTLEQQLKLIEAHEGFPH